MTLEWIFSAAASDPAGWWSADFWQRVVISLLGTVGSLLIAFVGFAYGSRQTKRQLLREGRRGRLARAVDRAEDFLSNYMNFVLGEMNTDRPGGVVPFDVVFQLVNRLNNDAAFNFLFSVSAVQNPDITRLFIDTDEKNRALLRSIVADVEGKVSKGVTEMSRADYEDLLNKLFRQALLLQIAVGSVEVHYTGDKPRWRKRRQQEREAKAGKRHLTTPPDRAKPVSGG